MSTSQQTDPLIGRLVDGRYRVRARIARGGMATVYVATDLRLERRIALKVMHGHLSDDSVFQSRFVQEARAAARLADPHVVNVFDQGQDGDMAYLVMEYLPGITLRELMREQRRLSIPQTITIMDAVLSGLAAAHRAGIVHRDVKPENVLLAEDGRIKIGDFGLARATTANTATGQMLLGTIAYLAPELVTRGTADARSDIYALGIMLYEMLTGEQPYKGEQPMQIAYQHATDSVPRPSVKNPGIPEQLDELVLWATERAPDDRPVDASAMLDRLRDIERELGIAPQVVRTIPSGTVITDTTGGASGELTKVLPGSFTAPTPAVDPDNATRLRTRAKRNVSKGAWLVFLVVLLAGLAGGAGWWFGSGPGSLVAVPHVEGLTSYAEAEQVLLAESLVPTPVEEHDLQAPIGTVLRTDPGSGTRVDKDTSVAVYVSAGPAVAEVQSLQWFDVDEARDVLAGLNLSLADNEYFFSDAEAGQVLSIAVMARGTEDRVDCSTGCSVYQGDTAVLGVSSGPIPDVAGLSVDDATAKLGEVELTVSEQRNQYNNDFAGGEVISALGPDSGSLSPGGSVVLVVSDGPEPFPVPNVVGMTRDEAKTALSNAGFKYTYSGFWDAVLDGITKVTAQSPGSDAKRPLGTTITLTISGAF